MTTHKIHSGLNVINMKLASMLLASLFVIAVAHLGSCSTPATGAANRVSVGMWGGKHIGMEVTDTGARIEYDCAHGTVDQQLVADENGRFEVQGVHIQESGGPVREGEEDKGRPARYTGRVEGKTMTLTVRLAGADEPIGTYTLTYGRSPLIRKCQ